MLRRLLHVVVVLLASSGLPGCEPPVCCVEDGDCGGELGCFDGRCSYPCSTDDECAPAEICARPVDGRAPGVCVAPGEDFGECRERQAPPIRDGGQARDAGGPVLDAGGPGQPDGGPRDAGRPDAGTFDAGTFDAGTSDAGSFDAGAFDAGAFDAGAFDAGAFDGGAFDAGTFDAGTFDAGMFDAGTFDAGAFDAGTFDAGTFDAGAFDAGPVECVDDALEDNDDRPSATLLLESEPTVSGVLCPDDPDLFRVPVFAGETLVVSLTYQAPPGMRLTVSRAGTGIIGTSATGTGTEEVTFEAASTGFVFVRVAAVVTGFARPYGLAITRSSASGCVDDAFEPNDSQQQATSTALPALVQAQLCAPDPDFFQVSPANRTQLTVDLVDQPFVGLVVTVLRRTDFTILAVISSASGPTVVELGDQPTGPLLFIVGGVQDAAYTLSID